MMMATAPPKNNTAACCGDLRLQARVLRNTMQSSGCVWHTHLPPAVFSRVRLKSEPQGGGGLGATVHMKMIGGVPGRCNLYRLVGFCHHAACRNATAARVRAFARLIRPLLLLLNGVGFQRTYMHVWEYRNRRHRGLTRKPPRPQAYASAFLSRESQQHEAG